MQTITKKNHLLHLIAIIVFASVLFIGCNNGEEKAAETPAPVENATEVKPVDSLPPIDTNATSRPETKEN